MALKNKSFDVVPEKLIEIDGSQHEGGGQMLRTAIGLSLLLMKPFRMINIRQNREDKGLKLQHLSVINILLSMTDSKVLGAELGSSEVTFYPGKFTKFSFEYGVGSAGSINLICQSLLIPLIFSRRKISLKLIGGTDVPWSPFFDYFRFVFLPHLHKFSDVKYQLSRRGFYPAGGGVVELSAKTRLEFDRKVKINLDNISDFKNDKNQIILDNQGKLLKVNVKNFASNQLASKNVIERIEKTQRIYLNNLKVPLSFENQYCNSESIGVGTTIVGIYSTKVDDIDENNPIILGTSYLGDKNLTSENIGEFSAKSFLSLNDFKLPCDDFLADQLIPYLGIFGGRILVRDLTSHLQANIYVTELFLGCKFTVEKLESGYMISN